MNNSNSTNPANFNYYGPSQNSSWGQPQQFGGYTTSPLFPSRLVTNASFVTSLEEALIKTTERNSDMFHFHQDKNEFYRVKVDAEGRKSWAAFTYNIPNPDDNVPATKADIIALLQRIEALEGSREAKTTSKKKPNTKEVIDDAESNG